MVLGGLCGLAGFGLFLANIFPGVLDAPVLKAPTVVAINCRIGDCYLYQRSGSESSGPGYSLSSQGGTTLTTAEVVVMGPNRAPVPTWSGDGSETITEGSAIYASAVGFHATVTGGYEIRINRVTPAALVVAPSLGSAFIRAAPWLLLTGVGVVVGLLGVALLVWAARRRHATRSGPTLEPVMPNAGTHPTVVPAGDRPPPPGWYDDPGGEHRWRWWDGHGWTAHVAPTSGSVAMRPMVELVGDERRAPRPARVAVVIYEATFYAIYAYLEAAAWRRFFHSLRLWFHSPAIAPAPPSGPSYLVELAGLAAGILLLIWQYRAAILARELGYTATRSPGWGVAVWFLPVVNLWMPYQALRDLLPSAHPVRRRVLAAWLLMMASWVLPLGTMLAAELATPLRVGLLALQIAMSATVAYLAWRIVAEVGDAHRLGLADRSLREVV